MNANTQTDSGSEPEQSRLTLGYIPLVDCAALVVAKEQGYFEEQGLEVALQAEPSWANIRDKVVCGLLDGAQMLAAMPMAATFGAGPVKKPMLTAFSMSLNGNAITVSNGLYDRLWQIDAELHSSPMRTGAALKILIDQERKAGLPPLVLAHVYNFSSHNYQLRYWLAACGIDPETDVRLVVVPPPQMGNYLAIGNIDGYCVGEPWNTLAVDQGTGRVLISGFDIWQNAPEKVFGVTEEWADAHPNTHKALLRALLSASIWLEQPGNREAAAVMLSEGDYIPLPTSLLSCAMTGSLLADRLPGVSFGDITLFHQHHANFPWLSNAQWFIAQMYRWGHLTRPMNFEIAARRVYKPALFREVAAAEGLVLPGSDYRSEPVDAFVDGQLFHPQTIVAALRQCRFGNVQVDLDELAAVNAAVAP